MALVWACRQALVNLKGRHVGTGSAVVTTIGREVAWRQPLGATGAGAGVYAHVRF